MQNEGQDFSLEIIEDDLLNRTIILSEKVRAFGKTLQMGDEKISDDKQLYRYKKAAFIIMVEIHRQVEQRSEINDMLRIIIQKHDLLLKEIDFLEQLEKEVVEDSQSYTLDALQQMNMFLLPPSLIAGIGGMNFKSLKMFDTWSSTQVLLLFLFSTIAIIVSLNLLIAWNKRRKQQKRIVTLLKVE